MLQTSGDWQVISMIARLLFDDGVVASLSYGLLWAVEPANDGFAQDLQTKFNEVLQQSDELSGEPVEKGLEAVIQLFHPKAVERWPAGG